MSNDAPKRINDPSSASSAFARDLVSSANQDAPPASAKADARNRFERFLASESSVMSKNPETNMPLFGSTVDVLENAAKSPVPSTSNTTTEPAAAPAAKNDFFAKAMGTVPPPASGNASGDAPTGARNENSALFSLASLSGEPEEKPKSAPKPKSDAGVIDIKSLATGASAVDEILSVAGGGGLASPLAAPVLAPVPAPTQLPSPESSKPKGGNTTVIASVLGASMIIGGGILGAAFLLKSGQQQTQIGSENNNQGNSQGNNNQGNNNQGGANNAGVAGGTNNGTAGGQPAGTGAPPTGTGAPPTGTGAPSTGPAGTAPSTGRGERPSRTPRNPSGTSANTPAPTGANTPPPAGTSSPAPSNNSAQTTCALRCRGDIACLLQCGSVRPSGPSGSSPAPSSGGSVPSTPQRTDVASAMRSVQSAVRACSAGQTGTAMISITFASSGRVTTAVVEPPFAGTPMGSCMARAVRSATVPEFSQPSFRVQYPFML